MEATRGATIYTTKNGVRLEIGRIPRQEIDRFVAAHPMPEPPTRKQAAFGDIEEDVPVLDDPGFQRAMVDYYVKMGHDQVSLIVGAVKLVDGSYEALLVEAGELREVGVVEDEADLLRYIILGNTDDLAAVIGEVFYLSTVTERGIDEARRMFNVTWAGQGVETWHVAGTPGRYGQMFQDRLAAKFGGYNWGEFCELSGPQQSAAVAFYRLSNRLEALMAQQK